MRWLTLITIAVLLSGCSAITPDYFLFGHSFENDDYDGQSYMEIHWSIKDDAPELTFPRDRRHR